MKVFKPSQVNQTLKFIQRKDIPSLVTLILKDEFDGTEISHEVNTYVSGGYVFIDFNQEFLETDKGEIKILSFDEVVYRGEYYATDQDPQKFELTLDTNIYPNE